MKLWVGIVGVLVVALLLWVGWGAYARISTEQPPYRVLERLGGGVEIRQYEAQTWISTDYDSDDSSFRVLASYIFGGNEREEKIAMTAPVITDRKMVFILPEGVTPENAPAPDGQPIEFTEVPPRTVAALAFSWTTPDERVRSKTDELLGVLRAANVPIQGEPFLMRYNDPATPPFMRRNEVAVEVLLD
jgi:hypothetical protein